VTHIAAALFFGAVLLGALALLHLLVRDYWQEIGAALRGDMPVRESRPESGRVRVKSRARPATPLRAAPQQRVAA
jgi:hypothetical protein